MKETQNYQHIICEEDEIDLRDLFRTIAKRKWFVVIFTFVATLAAVIYVYVATPIYEVKSNVRVGYMPNLSDNLSDNIPNTLPHTLPHTLPQKLIDDPHSIVRMLLVVFNVDGSGKSKKKFVSKVSSITIDKKVKDFLVIKTEAISNKEALKLNKKVVKYLQEFYNPQYKAFVEFIQVKIKSIQNRIRYLKEKRIPTLKKLIAEKEDRLKAYTGYSKELLSKHNDKNFKTIVSIQILNYQNLSLQVQKDLNFLRGQLSQIENSQLPRAMQVLDTYRFIIKPVNMKNSYVVGGYIVNDYPIKPKKRLIVIVAFVTGLIFSIFLVFFLEFLQTLKEEDKQV